jgi:tRNA A37 threonylcarbamoyladenosine synthetase subunit TsaC/SUA5/YrdC
VTRNWNLCCCRYRPQSGTASWKRGRVGYWTLPCLPETPVWLREHESRGAHNQPPARSLCVSWNGPLVSTSANRHGKPPATSALGVRLAFDAGLDYILHGPLCGTGKPSEIRDGITGRLLRNKPAVSNKVVRISFGATHHCMTDT